MPIPSRSSQLRDGIRKDPLSCGEMTIADRVVSGHLKFSEFFVSFDHVVACASHMKHTPRSV